MGTYWLAVGLSKYSFLCLRNLTVVQYIRKKRILHLNGRIKVLYHLNNLRRNIVINSNLNNMSTYRIYIVIYEVLCQDSNWFVEIQVLKIYIKRK